MQESDQRSALPLVLIVGLLAVILLAVVIGGLFFVNPSGGIQSHSSPFRFSYSSGCSAGNRDCTITIRNNLQSNGTLHVAATGSLPTDATISPSLLTIAPGDQAQMIATVPAGQCLVSIKMNVTSPSNSAKDILVPFPPCDATSASPSPTP